MNEEKWSYSAEIEFEETSWEVSAGRINFYSLLVYGDFFMDSCVNWYSHMQFDN